MENKSFDVIIIGGSIAGLSAAMTLGRAIRNVLVIDIGTPCSRYTSHSHNFITNDGRDPLDIISTAREEVLKYETVEFYEGKAVDIESNDGIFSVILETGENFNGSKVLLCTGLNDITPKIPGFTDCWGTTILHCPYCHGYEVREETTAILANGEAAYHLGTLINNWSKDLTVLTNGTSQLRKEEAEKLEGRNIKVIEKEIEKFVHAEGQVNTVRFADGSTFQPKVLYASIPFEQQSDLAEKLGCKMTSHGHIDIDDEQRTSIEGVYAAGDNTAQQRAVSVASAAGTKAGFTINLDLILK